VPECQTIKKFRQGFFYTKVAKVTKKKTMKIKRTSKGALRWLGGLRELCVKIPEIPESCPADTILSYTLRPAPAFQPFSVSAFRFSSRRTDGHAAPFF
jgi:hypothetical protein